MSKKKKAPGSARAQDVFSNPALKHLNSPLVAQKTTDGFRNLAMKLGVAARGEQSDNVLSDGTFRFNLITRNRILLEASYRGSWIVGRVVDCIAEDMVKAGIILTTNEGADKLQEFKVQMSRLQIWQRVRDTTAWGRLYGGAIGVLQIDGQRLDTPLDPETIEQGQFRGIAVYDRWQLNPVLSRVIEEGPDIGLPAFYDIVLGSNLNDPGQVPGQGSMSVAPNTTQPMSNESSQANYGGTAGAPYAANVRVHYTRCFRMGGHKLPFFQAITEMMWDESVIERMWDRLIEFETATASAGGLIGRALLRTVGIEGLREILAAGGEAKSGLIEMFDYMRQFQTSEGLTLLDKNDTFQTTAYSFAGLSDILERFGEQLSGASETPLVRLFGQTPGGLNSNGDADIRNYYDSINAKQEAYLRNPMEIIIKVMWQSVFGEPKPKDLSFIFTPLWQMTAKDKADITALNTNSIITAHGEGLVDTPTAMKELKQASADTGVFTNITDEKINEAETEMPPMPEEAVEPATKSGGVGDPGTGPAEPLEKIGPKGINAKDSKDWWSKFVGALKGAKTKDSDKGRENLPRKKTADQKAIEAWLLKKM